MSFNNVPNVFDETLKVHFWWRRRKGHFRDVFYDLLL